MLGTVQPSRPGRRVVRRRARPALEAAYTTVLGELPVAFHPVMIAYVEAKRAEFDARSALSSQMTLHGLRWHQIDRIARELAFTD